MFPELSLHPDYQYVEPGIRSLVRAINSLGIKTYWSCEGHHSPSVIQSPIPRVVMDHGSANHNGFGILIIAVGILNEKHLHEAIWNFQPSSRVGNGSPFLTLEPIHYSCSTPEILDDRKREVGELVKIISSIQEQHSTA